MTFYTFYGMMFLHLSSSRGSAIKAGILLSDQFIMLNLDLVLDTLRIANRVLEQSRFAWHILTTHNRPVASCNGFVVQPDLDWSEAGKLDYVLVITGFEPEHNLRRAMMCWLKMQHEAGAGLGCIDTGAFTLAAAGVLSPGQPVAIHWEFEVPFRRQYPALQVNSNGIACGKHFFSASGGLSVADMMLKLLAQHIPPDKLDEVRHILYSHGSKPLPAAAYTLPSDPLSRIERAELHMRATLSNPLSLAELAGMVNMHPRTFARHFSVRYGMTPMRYYRHLRLSHARDLLLQTSWSVGRIAELCGFAELTNFSSCFSGHHGVSPQQLRNESG
jgi:AraC family carnitine catabolism transcriptional activator